MEPNSVDWQSIVAALQAAHGNLDDPKELGKVAQTLSKELGDRLPQYERPEIFKATNAVLRAWKFKPDWGAIIIRILCLLPGRWTRLASSPGFGASTMLLLTDGTVMLQEQGGLRWKKLTPDVTGSYVNGTWTDLAPMHNTRRYFASAVLRDGRVFVCGGEYSEVEDGRTDRGLCSGDGHLDRD